MTQQAPTTPPAETTPTFALGQDQKKVFEWVVAVTTKMAGALPATSIEESLAAAISVLAVDRLMLLGTKDLGPIQVVEDSLVELLKASNESMGAAAQALLSEMDRQVRMLKASGLA